MTTAADESVVGVIGGLGPAATSYFFDLLVERTPAAEDQEHLRVIVDSNPSIPDRTGYLLDDGPDPVPALIETGRNVETAGADLLTVPCNTAHAFLDDVADAVGVPVLNMIELAAERVRSRSDIDRVGLLATDATIAIGLYHEYFEGRSVELVTPSDPVQDRVMEALYDIKAGDIGAPRRMLVDAVDSFGEVDAVVAGCTEVPVALSARDIDVPLVDPMTVMADRAIERAKPELASAQ